MTNPVGAPAKDAIIATPTKVTVPRQYKVGVPADNPTLPTDDFELQEQLKALAERVLQNMDEIVTIRKSVSNDRTEDLHITRREIFHWASNMASDGLIAQMHLIDRATLQSKFRKELDLARALAKYRLQDRLYDVAVSGQNASIMLFCAKNYLNMTDVSLTEALDAGTEDEEQSLQLSPQPVTALLKAATFNGGVVSSYETPNYKKD